MLAPTTVQTLVLRPATAADHAALRDLAVLDSRALGAGEHLVAEAGGRVVAALSTVDGTAVADPFVRTAEAIDLLRVRAAATSARPRRRLGRRVLRLPRLSARLQG